MTMICIHKADNPAVACLVRDWLQRNRITATLGASPPTVWVKADDKERAEALLAVFAGPVLVHPLWTCRCGEENAPTFGSCWSCEADRPGLGPAAAR